MNALRIALLNIRLVMRTKTVLFFTFVFPLVWLFVFEGIFAHGDPKTVMYFFGPVVTLNIMGSAFWGLGLQSVMQRERGILRRFRLAPISAVSLVAANLLANYLLELPTIALLVLCAKVIFHMPLTFGWWTLFVLVTIGTFGFAGFGLTIASIANTMQEAQIYNNLVWVTLLFLSGATIPLPLLPHWIQQVATFLPATYLVTSFQAVIIQAEPLLRHLPEMFALVLSGVFGLLFAWKLFRWEKEEKIPNRAKAWALLFVLPFILIGFWMTVYANPTKAWASTYSLLGSGSSKSGGDSASELKSWSLEDFDHFKSSEDLAATWRVTPEIARQAPHEAALTLIAPGAEATPHALRIEGNLEQKVALTEAKTVASSDLHLPKGAGRPEGIEFWVRGDGHAYRLRVAPENAASRTSPEITLVPSADWQPVRIPLPPAAGAGGADTPGTVQLQLAVAGAAGDFSFEIDQITLYARPGGEPQATGKSVFGPK
jgi:ABC-type multidrug transport system permease subunit